MTIAPDRSSSIEAGGMYVRSSIVPACLPLFPGEPIWPTLEEHTEAVREILELSESDELPYWGETPASWTLIGDCVLITLGRKPPRPSDH